MNTNSKRWIKNGRIYFSVIGLGLTAEKWKTRLKKMVIKLPIPQINFLQNQIIMKIID